MMSSNLRGQRHRPCCHRNVGFSDVQRHASRRGCQYGLYSRTVRKAPHPPVLCISTVGQPTRLPFSPTLQPFALLSIDKLDWLSPFLPEYCVNNHTDGKPVDLFAVRLSNPGVHRFALSPEK
jgi:hypothetical protein